jgi:hypothetical protein
LDPPHFSINVQSLLIEKQKKHNAKLREKKKKIQLEKFFIFFFFTCPPSPIPGINFRSPDIRIFNIQEKFHKGKMAFPGSHVKGSLIM